MAGAIQPRINKAIIDALTADDTLLDLMRELPGTVGAELPLYWDRVPASAPRPYIVFGPRDDTTSSEALRCGHHGFTQELYDVTLILEGIAPGAGIAVVDQIASLLDGLTVTVEGAKVSFLRAGGPCFLDMTTMETAVTHNGLFYRAQVR